MWPVGDDETKGKVDHNLKKCKANLRLATILCQSQNSITLTKQKFINKGDGLKLLSHGDWQSTHGLHNTGTK